MLVENANPPHNYPVGIISDVLRIQCVVPTGQYTGCKLVCYQYIISTR